MKKRLLNEQTTRRMMKLADIPVLAENFIEETEEVEEGMGVYDRDEEEPLPEEPPEGEEGALPPEGEEEPLEPDVGLEPETDVAEEGGEVAQAQDALVDALRLLAKLPGAKPVEVEGDGEEGVEELPLEEPPVEDLPPEGDELPPEEEVPLGPDEVEEDLSAAGITLDEEEDVVSEDDVINEVTRRVARRLLRESAKS